MNDIGTEMAKAAAETAVKEGSNKFSNVMGVIFPFFGLKRKGVEVYLAEIENSNLSPEMKMMTIANTKKTYKELKNQNAIAKIAIEYAKDGTDFSEASAVDDEWLARFMDSAKFVSTEQMQVVWGRVLAGEFEKPGTVPPQMIRVLSEIPLHYAKIFSTLCNLTSTISLPMGEAKVSFEALFVEHTRGFYQSLGIKFQSLSELQNLGLIKFDPSSGFINKISKEQYPMFNLTYGNEAITIADYPNMSFPVGEVLLTDVGRSLSRIVEKSTVEGHLAAVKAYLTENNVIISEQS